MGWNFQPVLWFLGLFRALGFLPYSARFKKGHTTLVSSTAWTVISCILAIAVWIISSVSNYYVWNDPDTDDHLRNKFFKVFGLVRSQSAVINMLFCTARSRVLLDGINAMWKYDIQYSNTLFKKHKGLVLFHFVQMVNAIWTFPVMMYTYRQYHWEFESNWFWLIMESVPFMFCTFYDQLITTLFSFYRSHIEDLQVEVSSLTIDNAQSSRIRELRFRYNDLHSILQSLLEGNRTQIVISFGDKFVASLVFIDWYIQQRERPNWWYTIWTTIDLFRPLLFTIPGESTRKLTENIYETVEDLLVEMPAYSFDQDELELFHTQLMQEPIELCISGLYSIDHTYLNYWIATLCTFQVLMMQIGSE